jgi:predicted DNA-binding ribbon-helix-helix protein
MVSAFPSRVVASNEDSHSDRQSALVMRNISVRGHRTSIRLEPQIWESMTEICRREFCTPHDVCSYVAERKPPNGSLTSSLRVFILGYFRTCATEDGHRSSGHGQGMFMSQQQERREMRAKKADGRDR